MAAPRTRYAGGRSGVGPGRVVWQGATVKQQIDAGAQAAMDELAAQIEAWFRENLHRVTHDMVDKSFAVVTVAGTKRTIRMGSASEHTLDHELGHGSFEGHPQLRQAADLFIPRLTPLLRAHFANADKAGGSSAG